MDKEIVRAAAVLSGHETPWQGLPKTRRSLHLVDLLQAVRCPPTQPASENEAGKGQVGLPPPWPIVLRRRHLPTIRPDLRTPVRTAPSHVPRQALEGSPERARSDVRVKNGLEELRDQLPGPPVHPVPRYLVHHRIDFALQRLHLDQPKKAVRPDAHLRMLP